MSKRKTVVYNKISHTKETLVLNRGTGRLKKPGEGLATYLEEDINAHIHEHMSKMGNGVEKLHIAMRKGTSVELKNRVFELEGTEIEEKYGVYKCCCTLHVSKGHLTIEDLVLHASVSFFKAFKDTVPESELVIDKDCNMVDGDRLFFIPFKENNTTLTCKVDISKYIDYFKTTEEELVRLSLSDVILYSSLGINEVIYGKLHCVNIGTGTTLSSVINMCKEGAEVTFATSDVTIAILDRIKEVKGNKGVLVRLLYVNCRLDITISKLLKYVDCLDNLITKNRYCTIKYLKYLGVTCSLADYIKGYRDYCTELT